MRNKSGVVFIVITKRTNPLTSIPPHPSTRFGLIHSTIDPVMFVQYFRMWSIIDSAASHVFRCLDGAIQFFHFTFWKVQYGSIVLAMGLRLWNVGIDRYVLCHMARYLSLLERNIVTIWHPIGLGPRIPTACQCLVKCSDGCHQYLPIV